MAKTFQIKTEGGGRAPHLYIRSFDLFGETWVIHTKWTGQGYRCSHKETGTGIPGTDADTIKDALAKAGEVLNGLGAEKVAGMLAKVRGK